MGRFHSPSVSGETISLTDSMEWVQASMYGWSWLWTVTGPLDGRCAVVVVWRLSYVCARAPTHCFRVTMVGPA